MFSKDTQPHKLQVKIKVTYPNDIVLATVKISTTIRLSVRIKRCRSLYTILKGLVKTGWRGPNKQNG